MLTSLRVLLTPRCRSFFREREKVSGCMPSRPAIKDFSRGRLTTADSVSAGQSRSRKPASRSVDDCIREWQATYEKAPADYITLIYHWAQQPKDDMLAEFDRFVNKVVPELEAPEYSLAAE